MLLKLARALAGMALGMILLHAMPAFCDEAHQIDVISGITSSHGCVPDDACCVSSSFIQTMPDVGLGILDLHAAGVLVHSDFSTRARISNSSQPPLHLNSDLSTLGKLNI